MKSVIDFFTNNVYLQKSEKHDINNEVRQSNTVRAVIIMLFSIVISGAIIFNYSQKLDGSQGAELAWRQHVILLNKIIAIIFTLLATTAFFLYKSKKGQTVLSSLVVAVVFVLIPLWGAIGAVLDQVVTASIISFFLVCVVTSVGLLMKPFKSLASFIIIYIVFYKGMGITQANPELLTYNRVMGFCCIATSLGLSFFFWRNNLVKLRQNRIIQKQTKELESNYEQLLHSSDELKKAVATKDKFFSILGHDLRGPLTATWSLTQLMNEGAFDHVPQERDKATKMVENGLQNIIKLLNDLLLWAGTQTNKITFTPERLNLHDTVNINMQLQEIAATKKSISLVSRVDKGIMLNADKNMINTILRNLISNAIKFSHENSVVNIYAHPVNTNNEENTIIISIADEGVGIHENTIQKLFKIEHKTTTPGTNNETGTGLGLILCKELIEQHNGRITVESAPGIGSVFKVHFPTV